MWRLNVATPPVTSDAAVGHMCVSPLPWIWISIHRAGGQLLQGPWVIWLPVRACTETHCCRTYLSHADTVLPLCECFIICIIKSTLFALRRRLFLCFFLHVWSVLLLPPRGLPWVEDCPFILLDFYILLSIVYTVLCPWTPCPLLFTQTMVTGFTDCCMLQNVPPF